MTENRSTKHYVVAITGASGSVYGVTLVSELLQAGHRVSLLLTSAGRQVLKHEMNLNWPEAIKEQRLQVQEYFASQVQEYFASIAVDCLAVDDFWSSAASGSGTIDGMIVIPCSMGTAGRIAGGLSGNLLERAADVMLKERRPLILVPRETPFNTIHLENLLRLSRAGAVILPAMPGFYHAPKEIDELVNFVVGKVLDQLDVPHDLFARWGEQD